MWRRALAKKKLVYLRKMANKGNLRIAKLLINHGADLTLKDKKGQAPFHVAKKKGYRSIVQLLQREYRKMQSNQKRRH